MTIIWVVYLLSPVPSILIMEGKIQIQYQYSPHLKEDRIRAMRECN